VAQLRHLTHGDALQAAALSRGVGWRSTAADWARLLTLAPDAAFARAGLRVERRLARMTRGAPIWATAGLGWDEAHRDRQARPFRAARCREAA
jgi:hypothetical protein